MNFEKNNRINIIKNLININDNNIFAEKLIRHYTRESKLCYSFEPSLIVFFTYYMSPLLFGLNEYVKENTDKSFTMDIILYRRLSLSEIEFYLYKIYLGNIICFPSFNSTCLEEICFIPTNSGQSVNNNYSEKK